MRTIPKEWGKLEDIKDYIDRMYNGPVQDKSLIEGALKGMVRSLEGAGGEFYTAREYAEILERPNKTRGTGIHLGVKDDRIVVIQKDTDSQADKAGILPGDVILRINGRYYKGSEIEAARNLMVSDQRRSVRLQFLRGDHQQEVRVRLRLLVKPRIRALLHEGIGIIRLPGFQEGTEQELLRILGSLKAEGAKGFVLDLRNTPTGGLTETVRAVSAFIPKGQMVVSLRDVRDKVRGFTSASGAFSGMPLAVLINGQTEGTAEFAAGALKQAGARLIGEPTLGEGRLESYLDLPQGEGIKLATGFFFVPDGQQIQGRGITPDVAVKGGPLAARNIIQPGDQQMEKALEIIRSLVRKG